MCEHAACCCGQPPCGRHRGIRINTCAESRETHLSCKHHCGGWGKGNGPIKPTHPPGGPGASLYSLAQSQAGSRAPLPMSRELQGTSVDLQSQWSCSEVPRKIWLRREAQTEIDDSCRCRRRSRGAGGEVSRQSTEEAESQRKSVFSLKNFWS